VFCQNCGNKIRNSQGVCVHCGGVTAPQRPVEVSQVAPPPQNSIPTAPPVNLGKLVASLVSVGVVIWFLYQVGIFGTQERTEATAPIPQVMHQSFSVGYWRYTVDRVLTANVLGRGCRQKERTEDSSSFTSLPRITTGMQALSRPPC
jgi:hypothetical protein